MDMQMPNIDGLDATRRIRQMVGREQVPIIAMTANAFSEDKARCFEAGMNDFLTKPFDPDVFFVTLLRVLGRSQSLVCEHYPRRRAGPEIASIPQESAPVARARVNLAFASPS
ncbi:MAG: response regulator [Sulfuritalea sp.]|nr:response regulator [Sulfuritalea sp.]